MKKTKTVLRKVCEAIESKKGDEVTIIDISKISSFTDFFVICHGHNEKQNQAICDEIMERLKKEKHGFPVHVEGYQHAEWILMDYLDFVVHILSPRSRRSYQLEKLWGDGIKVKPKALIA